MPRYEIASKRNQSGPLKWVPIVRRSDGLGKATRGTVQGDELTPQEVQTLIKACKAAKYYYRIQQEKEGPSHG